MSASDLLRKANEWGPVLFGVGFLAPLIAQSMEAGGIPGPWGLAPLHVGLAVGVTAGLIALAAAEDARMQESWLTANRDAGKHLSPNAGWPEAAMAGALDIRLGGPRRYGDREVAGAWFGDGSESAGRSDLRRALRLAKRVWIGSIVVAVIVALSLLNGGLR